MEVSIREMKNNLSRYLKRVQAGEEVIITDRGRPVARLGPVPQVGATSLEDALARLRASHLIRPGKGGKPATSRKPAPVPEGTIDELMRWVRGG